VTRVRGLLALPALLLAGCSDPPSSPADQYREGYRFGQQAPAAHVGVPAAPGDTAGADAECGEHAETDGIEPFPPPAEWMAGCVDGALGRAPAPPEPDRT
jgi:hypothetical protein